jgi:predicted TIM-barrel fold metal-dependent hydrolase
MGPLVGKWADPNAVDTVTEDLPDLKIVCSHAVYPRVCELIALANIITGSNLELYLIFRPYVQNYS